MEPSRRRHIIVLNRGRVLMDREDGAQFDSEANYLNGGIQPLYAGHDGPTAAIVYQTAKDVLRLLNDGEASLEYKEEARESGIILTFRRVVARFTEGSASDVDPWRETATTYDR